MSADRYQGIFRK